jgi:protein-L-isoaspartate(D-aspartate) O-methyltransferase
VNALREEMVERQLIARGIRDPLVIGAMATVPREAFVPVEQAEFAYDDRPLPIGEGQTISQPYVVAAMLESLQLRAHDRVLEVGAGSGYAAALLGCIAREVYTIERHPTLAATAEARLEKLGCAHVRVRCGDGTLGWPEAAPFDAIVVAAGGPAVPESLRQQLRIGGRLVIPVGEYRMQRLIRVTRVDANDFLTEDLGAVSFVPLIGVEGWRGRIHVNPGLATPHGEHALARLIAESCEPLQSIEDAPLMGLVDRIGDARVVLIGAATHGTSEFQCMRARITRELILRGGFRGVAIDGDGPDAARVDRFVRPRPRPPEPDGGGRAFSCFPSWMWRNAEVDAFVRWLREFNRGRRDDDRVGFFGLDLYSHYASMDEVVRYLERVAPELARIARERYGCLTPWQTDPGTHGRAPLPQRFADCEEGVVSRLRDLHQRRLERSGRYEEDLGDAVKHAQLVADAERYYRALYYGARESWSLRDRHLFDVLSQLAQHDGKRLVVWAHNSHVGDASATEMGALGEHNLGQLCRARFGDDAFLIGFGSDGGTVAAAHDWDEPVQVMRVRPAHADSYERLGRDTGRAAFLLHLRHPRREAVRDELEQPRLERAIGAIYRPETEPSSHYFQAILPRQLDEWIYFAEPRAVTPLPTPVARGLQETFPLRP